MKRSSRYGKSLRISLICQILMIWCSVIEGIMAACSGASVDMGKHLVEWSQWSMERWLEERMSGSIWERPQRLRSSRVVLLERRWEHAELTLIERRARCQLMRTIWESVLKRWAARMARRWLRVNDLLSPTLGTSSEKVQIILENRLESSSLTSSSSEAC